MAEATSSSMLLDTSGLLCCFDASDSRHEPAIQAYLNAQVRITHNYVISEFVALCQARGMPRPQSLAFASDILADTEVEVVWVEPALHEEAMALLQTQLDKTYSLTDAVSFTIMAKHNLMDALTTDRHFDQAGFRRLLMI